MELNLRKARFMIETFPGKIFDGYTLDEGDGWANPYFTFEESQKIAEAHEEMLNAKAHYDRTEDKFILEFFDYLEDYKAMWINEKKLYPIGTFVWIWEEA